MLISPLICYNVCVSLAVNERVLQQNDIILVHTKSILPDCMFIRKMLQSDWLDYRAWTIYTFPYRRSGSFIWLSIKVKTQDFQEDDRETIDRGREKLATFGKLSVNFRKLSGKT